MIKYNLHKTQRLSCYPVSRVICMLCILNNFAISFFSFYYGKKNRYMLVIEYFSQDKMIYTESVFSPPLKENCSNIIIRFLINYRRQIPQLYFVEKYEVTEVYCSKVYIM